MISFIINRMLALFIVIASVQIAAADALDSGIFAYGEGDYDEAISILMPLAKSGDKQAIGYLALTYLAQEDHKNLQEFMSEIEHIAEKGDANFQFMLASIFRLPNNNISNPDMAYKWMKSAADTGHLEAIYALKEMESDKSIDRLERNTAYLDALPAVLTLAFALVGLLLSSKMNLRSKSYIYGGFIGIFSYTIANPIVNVMTEFNSGMSSSVVLAVTALITVLTYFILDKFLIVFTYAKDD